MIVKHINKTTFDVFFDLGWENWARFQVENGTLKQVNGVTTPANIRAFLEKRYKKG